MRLAESNYNGGRPQVAIIVPVADIGDETTKRCVEHLERTVKMPFHLILVESNGSEFAFGKSINEGMRRAAGFEVVIGMNSDSFPRPTAVEKLLVFMREHPEVGYAGSSAYCKDLYPFIGICHCGFLSFMFHIGLLKLAPFYALRKLRVGIWQNTWLNAWSDGPRTKNPQLIVLGTWLFAMRRECWKDIGGLDEGYYLGWSDVDTTFRVMLSDWYLSACIAAEVEHDGRGTATPPNKEWFPKDTEHFQQEWPKERTKQVQLAAKAGKFRWYE